MGFIEDERRKHATKLSEEKSRQSILQQREKDQRSIEVSEKAAGKVKSERSKQYFEQSGLGGMIKELGETGSHRYVQENDPTVVWKQPGGNYNIEILGVGGVGWEDRKVRAVITADGDIKIEGDRFGSTTLSKDKWQGKGGPEALERALEKAYKHPDKSGPRETNTTESYPGN